MTPNQQLIKKYEAIRDNAIIVIDALKEVDKTSIKSHITYLPCKNVKQTNPRRLQDCRDIISFYIKKGRLPKQTLFDDKEMSLAKKLWHIRSLLDKRMLPKEEHNILLPIIGSLDPIKRRA